MANKKNICDIISQYDKKKNSFYAGKKIVIKEAVNLHKLHKL